MGYLKQTNNQPGSGKVFITGAGPGTVDLLTIKAYHAIQNADCIVYDRLVGAEILALARPNAELIYVGKESRGCSELQAWINAILVEKAEQGKQVVRLKGGDPFVFGRGFEEIIELAKHQINYEIIPGVSSLLSAPAAAGIPLTHRGMAREIHVFTGHYNNGELDFSALAKLAGTLVFFMAIQNLASIITQLHANGMPEYLPVAIIENGALSTQRVILGTLNNIVELSHENNVTAPALLIIGEVAALDAALEFADKF